MTRALARATEPAPKPPLPIGALAREAGVSTRTVRYYEEIGLLATARRFAGGRRVFGEDALQRLKFIARLKGLGLSLDEIRHLNEIFALHRSTRDMLAALDGLLAGHIEGLARQMEALGAARGELLAYRQRIRARLAVLRGRREKGRK